jgi:hypothetical protein
VSLQMRVQITPDAEARDALAQAREALRRFDEESMRAFNREISGAER